MKQLPYRQIHLDFHTGDAIPSVGEGFSPDEFAGVLDDAGVDSITCFARCHHGWLYYDSCEFPELIHPKLVDADLLKKQIEACHAKGIRVPIYTTIQWDGKMSYEHPEYCVIAPDGSLDNYAPQKPGFYTYLCVNTPYREFLKAHLEEILTTLPTDGIFMDIVQERDCSCRYCKEGMHELGLDPLKKADRMKYAHIMIREFKKEIAQFIRSFNPDCTIFFNGSHVGPGIRDSLDAYTHLEVESLPSGGWGYTHFPLVSRFTRTLGKEFLGMTGKFHTYWGDFHSLKNQAALEFECFSMLAAGGGCSIGDQLLPSGKIDHATYELIGNVYRSVREKEPWCRDVTPVVDIGVFNLEEWADHESPAPMIGIMRMLEESAAQFDIIDSLSDFSRYKLLIMPDSVPVDEILAGKIREYLIAGGSLIASFESGLTPDGNDFALDEFGIRKCAVDDTDWQGERSAGKDYFTNDYCDFIRHESPLHAGLPDTELAMYIRGLTVEASAADTELLGSVIKPWFYRTPEHYSSHQHTPSSGEVGAPAVTRRGNVIYFSHPICTTYRKKGPRWVKTMLVNAVDMLIDRRVRHNGPSTLKVTLNSQEAKNRWVAHLIHYIPERRAEQIEIIEDVIPLHQLGISLQTGEQTVTGVVMVPEGRELPFLCSEDKVEFTVPEVRGHSMIEIRFGEA